MYVETFLPTSNWLFRNEALLNMSLAPFYLGIPFIFIALAESLNVLICLASCPLLYLIDMLYTSPTPCFEKGRNKEALGSRKSL